VTVWHNWRSLTRKEQQLGAFDPTLKCGLHEGSETLIVDGVDLDAADFGQEEADNIDVTSLELKQNSSNQLQLSKKDRSFFQLEINCRDGLAF
jgi:hypothetical protein